MTAGGAGIRTGGAGLRRTEVKPCAGLRMGMELGRIVSTSSIVEDGLSTHHGHGTL